MQRSSTGMSPTTDISHSAARRWHGLMTYKPVPFKVLRIMSGADGCRSNVLFMLYRLSKEVATQRTTRKRGVLIHLRRPWIEPDRRRSGSSRLTRIRCRQRSSSTVQPLRVTLNHRFVAPPSYVLPSSFAT